MAGRVVIAGGSGFLGRTLAGWYAGQGREVVVLSRGAGSVRGARVVGWDGKTLGPWVRELEGSGVLVNLAGRSVNCRYHARNRKSIMNSRLHSVRVLGAALRACDSPPALWLQSSTATIYKHTYGPAWGESGETGATAEAKDAFSIEVARAWEAALDAEEVPGVRRVKLRTAIVFGREPGGVYSVVRRLVRFGLGGAMAGGKQWVSWIHAEDFCRALDWIEMISDAEGVYNLASPNPVTNSEQMTATRAALGMPIGLTAARWMLELGAVFPMRTETELIIKSRRVVAERLLDEGFIFRYPEFRGAMMQLEGKVSCDEAQSA
ncbi:MAG: DUF1731 domain-containing protein [Phycisphaeraceae bacterium]